MPSAPTLREMNRNGVVILEPEAEGHSQEWLQHLMDFIASRDVGVMVWLVTPATLCHALSKTMPPSDRKSVV